MLNSQKYRFYTTLLAAVVLIGLTWPISDRPNVSFGQTAPAPSPSPMTLLQGQNNLGQVALLTMEEVFEQTGIEAWHAQGWTGKEMRIGVLDRGFGYLLDFEQRNELNVFVRAGANKSIMQQDPEGHGTLVLEAVHAVAPEALLFACSYTAFDDYRRCINWFVASDVDIIHHSTGIPALPLDGKSAWASEVERVVREDVLWVNAAGNFAYGYTEDYFTDADQNTYHEFLGSQGTEETLGIIPIPIHGEIMLSWQNANDRPANAIDLDLEIVDARGNILAQSSERQNGAPGQLAIERVWMNMDQAFGVRVRHANNEGLMTDVHFVLFVEFADLSIGQSTGSIISPGDSLMALTVGALQNGSIAPYSSRGPLTSGAIKPDLVTIGEILLPSGTQFIGTSASTAMATGIAALVWEAHPEWALEDLVDYLRNMTQDDPDFEGPDVHYGAGIVYLGNPNANGGVAASLPDLMESPTPAVTPSQEPFVAEVVIDADLRVNLRAGPGINYEIVTKADPGQRFPVLAQYNGWWQIRLSDGTLAWVSGSLTTVNREGTTIPVAQSIPVPPTPIPLPPQSATAIPSSSQTCIPGAWEACGAFGCPADHNALCNDNGTGYTCVWNPASCAPAPSSGSAASPSTGSSGGGSGSTGPSS